ncbi:hypothetical protein [Streptomyces sp. NPDC060002]|uniref:hypothetical protein n=1 Tax=Streptomyces sp. NPDC060002 TaxID=3347033 RepID=UPI0036907594
MAATTPHTEQIETWTKELKEYRVIVQSLHWITFVIARIIGLPGRLIRRIENARTPAPVWDDPTLLARGDADNRQGSPAPRGHQIAQA